MDKSGEIRSEDGEGLFAWTDFDPPEKEPDEGAEVVAGLTAVPKTLPPKFFL